MVLTTGEPCKGSIDYTLWINLSKYKDFHKDSTVSWEGFRGVDQIAQQVKTLVTED